MSSSEYRLQPILSQKKWFGFDLDDTLHEFRKASGQASQSVFEAIDDTYGLDIDRLKTTYQQILRTATANAFTDGRTSTQYRRERFTRLLQAHGIDDSGLGSDEAKPVDPLLDIYKSSLKSSLALKEHALPLLQTLQQLGKKVIVITEGPADAQEWTVKELGLWPYIDVLVTTNEVGRSKVDGLFKVMLERYGIAVDEIVYFGDNELRDIQPAQEEGILAVLYDEKQQSRLEDSASLRVQSWEALLHVLDEE
ncbi:uncharacterized protein N7459_008075 [Penicillium hispanicum]|uniref:uncharacterized protein n=1 Tax=Penicillium hispanicum TaxID=1080232 RepID=UPI00254186E3|nr:uncharacterized protein N7459_008075 [Penicillium hispanicum]KAJ5573648.1 hypothetical protein N7459_008075 [Penicillium hispanicum]